MGYSGLIMLLVYLITRKTRSEREAEVLKDTTEKEGKKKKYNVKENQQLN